MLCIASQLNEAAVSQKICGSPILQSHLAKHTLTCRHVVHAIEVREARLVPGIVGLVDECSDCIYAKLQ